MRSAEIKETVCPAFAALIPLLNSGRSGLTVETVRRHVKSCPRCAFALRLLKQLLREELTSEEKTLIDSIRPSKRLKKFRRFGKNLV